jgi:hypothetical protein
MKLCRYVVWLLLNFLPRVNFVFFQKHDLTILLWLLLQVGNFDYELLHFKYQMQAKIIGVSKFLLAFG